jgi:hypothetical protein
MIEGSLFFEVCYNGVEEGLVGRQHSNVSGKNASCLSASILPGCAPLERNFSAIVIELKAEIASIMFTVNTFMASA